MADTLEERVGILRFARGVDSRSGSQGNSPRAESRRPFRPTGQVVGFRINRVRRAPWIPGWIPGVSTPGWDPAALQADGEAAGSLAAPRGTLGCVVATAALPQAGTDVALAVASGLAAFRHRTWDWGSSHPSAACRIFGPLPPSGEADSTLVQEGRLNVVRHDDARRRKTGPDGPESFACYSNLFCERDQVFLTPGTAGAGGARRSPGQAQERCGCNL